MAQTYAKCSTYADKGTATVTYVGPNGSWVERSTFSTAFVRPDKFRFEYRSDPKECPSFIHIVHVDPAGVRTWSSGDGQVRTQGPLDSAIAEATGTTATAAHSVPRLLMPGVISGNSYAHMTDLRVMADDRVGEDDCYRIRGLFAGVRPVELWIRKSDLLLRRIDRGKLTTVYEGAFNSKLSPKQLALGVPSASSLAGADDGCRSNAAVNDASPPTATSSPPTTEDQP